MEFRKYQLFIAGLGLFIVGLIVTALIQNGTPISQRDLELDQIRINNFSQLSYLVENYYTQYKILPTSLDILTNAKEQDVDPKTKAAYTYTTSGLTAYKLCTTFATDTTKQISSQNKSMVVMYPGQNDLAHPKGYACITYTIPPTYIPNNPYLYQPQATPLPPANLTGPVITQPSCVGSDDDGSDITISWTDKSATGVPYVDISLNTEFTSFYHKQMANVVDEFATTADFFIRVNSSGNETLTYQPNTIYYVRYFNGQTESPTTSFKTKACSNT